ncbi:MAG TPA: sigma-70 family RNA polymerase sigma factor [Pirellulaceae bacterium]|nr:sigma-70 family RNA polymerase sigma factor [Pirellulaceae bacterium]
MSTEHHQPRVQPEDSYERFVRLFARHEPALRSFVRPLVPHWDDADEVLQQTCVVLWRKFAEFDTGSDFLAWACTIARFEVLKHRRRIARDRHVFSEELLQLLADEGAAEADARQRERRALDHCLELLPAPQRELIQRCYGDAGAINAAAAALGRSATSVYKALQRVREVLLECIERRLAQEAIP